MPLLSIHSFQKGQLLPAIALLLSLLFLLHAKRIYFIPYLLLLLFFSTKLNTILFFTIFFIFIHLYKLGH